MAAWPKQIGDNLKYITGIARAAALGAVIGAAGAGFWALEDKFGTPVTYAGVAVVLVLFQWTLKAAK
jgi:hypothetical protein